MATLLHDSAARTLERLLKLVNTTIRHRNLLVLINLLGCLRSDTVNSRASRVHLGNHWRRCLVPRLRLVVRFALLAIILVLVDGMRLSMLFNSDFGNSSALVQMTAVVADSAIASEHLLKFGRFFLVGVGKWSVHRGCCIAGLVRARTHGLVVTKRCMPWFVMTKCDYVRAVSRQMLRLRSSCSKFSWRSMLDGLRITWTATAIWHFKDRFVLFVHPFRLARAHLLVVRLVATIGIWTLVESRRFTTVGWFLDRRCFIVGCTFNARSTSATLILIAKVYVILLLLKVGMTQFVLLSTYVA